MGFVISENQKLNYLRFNQNALRTESYKNVQDAIREQQKQDAMLPDDHMKIGKQILPSTFIGSPRWYHKQYLDGMAIVRLLHHHGSFTNFKLKKDQLLDDLTKQNVLGQSRAYMWVIEFQKRGLPHIHLLLILDEKDRPTTPAQVDDVITAELPPDPDTLPAEQQDQATRLDKLVLSNMIHGPCGKLNPRSPCMVDGQCSKHFPKPFCQNTFIDPDSCYPQYKRISPLQGGRQINIYRNGKKWW